MAGKPLSTLICTANVSPGFTKVNHINMREISPGRALSLTVCGHPLPSGVGCSSPPCTFNDKGSGSKTGILPPPQMTSPDTAARAGKLSCLLSNGHHFLRPLHVGVALR
jgi:hypothetical protein